MPSSVECRLLALPAELRNRIYQFTVVYKDAGSILINSNVFPEPGLILTCKKLREEALPIYYLDNTFTVDVGDWDSTPLLAMQLKGRLFHKLGAGDMFNIIGTFQPDWHNLHLWVYRVRLYGEIMVPPKLYDGSSLTAITLRVVENLLKLVLELQDLPWSRVGRLVSENRRTLVAIDRRWS